MAPLAWPFSSKQTLLLAIGATLVLAMHPARVANRVAFLVYHTPAALFRSVQPSPAPHTLKAAILNVTADFNELTFLLQDFLRSPGQDPSLEQQFRSYLAERAVRSHPRLESTLDWVLAFYKFAAPFLAISLLAKLTGGGSDEADEGRQPPLQYRISSALPLGGSMHAVHAVGGSPLTVATAPDGAGKAGGRVRVVPPPEPGPGTPQDRRASELRAQLDLLAEPYRRQGRAEDSPLVRAY